ncbi:MAG: hypothetical protein LBE57_02855 [Methanosarcinales archaeon]|nr:hypothetical protein [Methanosarcinales archaeon]
MKQSVQGQTMKPMELDLIGQYYASIINRKQSGVFALSAHLKEPIDPRILQQAVNDLMRRLPFLNGRLKRSFFHYKNEILTAPPQVKPAGAEPLFCNYYNRGSRHMLSIVYGERHFTVRTTHIICDGRSLSKIICAVLLRYYELLGVEADKSDIIDCSGHFQSEEAENAYGRFANPAAEVEKSSPNVKAYRLKSSKSAPQKVLTKTFAGDKVKAAAKAHRATVTEYLSAQILSGIAKERNGKGDKRPVIIMIPIDGRSFFPCRTLRSFVSTSAIVMPETEDFSEMVRQVSAQFERINKESVQKDINELQNPYHSIRYVPRVLKVFVMKRFERSKYLSQTTGFSNLGLIKLPLEVESRVERLEFSISLEQDSSYFFSCATVGNTLAFTATFREEGRDVVETVMKRLESPKMQYS